jgi:lactoylglutathione lyase
MMSLSRSCSPTHFRSSARPTSSARSAFYRDLLDGDVDYQFPPDGEPGYVGISIGDSHLGIARAPEGQTGGDGQRFALWVYAASCDAAVERLRAGGATVTEEPADQPWGERVARVLDPDGNEVIIGERR